MSKVGSHFSFYDCACVVTITVSSARITYEDYFFGQVGSSRQQDPRLRGARLDGALQPRRPLVLAVGAQGAGEQPLAEDELRPAVAPMPIATLP